MDVPDHQRYALLAVMFLTTATMGYLQPFMPLYLRAAELNNSQIGLVMGAGSALALLVQPLVGRLSDRFDSRRPFVCIAAALAGIAYTSYQFAEGLWAFVILTAIGANGTIYLTAAGGVLIGRLVTRDRGGAVYAAFRVWGSVGYIVTSVVASLLIQTQPAETLFTRSAMDLVFGLGPILFGLIAVLAWFLPDADRRPSREPNAKASMPPNVTRFLITFGLFTASLYGASSFISLHLQNLGATPLWITGAFIAGVIVEVFVMRMAGALSDRHGRKKVLAISYWLLPFRLALYAPAPGPAWVVGVQSLHGINFGIMGSVSVAFINDHATDANRGRLQAGLAASSGLAMSIAPVFAGLVSASFGLPAMFLTMSVLALATAILFSVIVQDPDRA